MSVLSMWLLTPTLLLAAAPAAVEPAPPDPASIQADLAALYERARAAVVRVHARGSSGTGFLVGDGTQVVTALHVVGGGRNVVVETITGVRIPARLVAWDRDDDLGVLRLDRVVDGTASLTLAGPAEQPKVGDTLVAIGHPLLGPDRLEGRRAGLLEWSLTAGLASAVGEHRIQTTTSVQPGNSGGPLLDSKARVVGVVSARLGDFGIAGRTQRLAALLDRPAPMIPHGPTLGGGVRAGLTFNWTGRPEGGPQFDLGLMGNVYLELDERFEIGLVSRFVRRNKPGNGWDKTDRIDILAKLGPTFDAPLPRGVTLGIRPFFTAGLQLRRLGREASTIRLDDPACDPAAADCSASITNEVQWIDVPGVYVGGGIGFDLDPGFLEFEAGVNVLDPEDWRFGITWGVRFGAPTRIPKARTDAWDADP